jgi:hypothetical protein
MKQYFMKPLLLIASCLFSCLCQAQDVFHLKADSVRMYSDCDTVELVIRNNTKNVPGVLYNRYDGRTTFQLIHMEALADGRTAITGQDTATIRMPAPLKSNYLVNTDACQTWNGEEAVIKRVGGIYYLKLDLPENKVDGKEVRISMVSSFEDDYYTGGSITFYSYSVPIYFNGVQANAYKLGWSSVSSVTLMYSAALNGFVVLQQWGSIDSSTRGSCPL